MNKAVPWNINGVGFDAREAAREAARRQGKSLGEWLHEVIADHASELGVEAHDIADRERIDAVTARLERLSGRSADVDRRTRTPKIEDAPRARSPRRDVDSDHDDDASSFRRPIRRHNPGRDPDASIEAHRARRASPMIEETEFLLEEAIDTMERRATRSERRTDTALASFAKMLETTEARRDRERDAVLDLSQKLSSIEAKLTSPASSDEENPIKGALTRLEARLDTIGKRSAAETVARQQAMRPIVENRLDNEPIRRLEDKLNTILEAVATRPQESPTSEGRTSEDPPAARRRLGEAIAEISRRQRVLDDPDAAPIGVPPAAEIRQTRPVFVHDLRQDAPWERSLSNMQAEIGGLATKIEEMRHHVVSRREDTSAGVDVDELRADINSMSQTLRELAPRATIAQLQDSINSQLSALDDRVSQLTGQPSARQDLGTGATALDKIEGRLDGLAQKLDDAIKVRPGTRSDVAGMERLLLDLGRKIEAAQAPGSDDRAIEALQRQIELLSARFERSEDGLASLASLQRSMQDLFAHLEQTRTSVEASAAEAAREVLRIALEEGRGQTSRAAPSDVAALKALQRDADARTTSTLNAVHQTLEHVVGRMCAMESDLAQVRRIPFEPTLDKQATKSASAPSKSVRPPTPDLALSVSDPLFDPLFAQKPSDRSKKPQAAAVRPKTAASEDESGRADFIAAARRAAQAAQTDPSVVAFRQPSMDVDSDARAGLMAKSRAYVATHKRPVLLSVAAVFVVLGTMAIVQRMTFDGGDEARVASSAAPTQIERMADAAVPPAPVRSAAASATPDELTPSALPKAVRALSAQIPGSDPVQTGSIQTSPFTSLPSFAAQAAGTPAPRPALPPGLVAMADAGDGAAEYALASHYADGKLVPRDFKLAAKWYEKAADQKVAPAQYRLAALYEKGLGVPQDKDRAKALYQRAADAGNPRAMHNLAVLLADGNGKPDYAGAAVWFRKAAQYGVHDSQYNLAILLARGLGVDASLVQSYQWFSIAAAQNDTDAAKKRDEVGDKLSANDLAVAKALAASFQPRTANAAATDIAPPPGGWDSLGAASHINSARSKISSL